MMTPTGIEAITTALEEIGREVVRAKEKHPGDFHSRHEAYAVLLEEVDELKEVVWKDYPDDALREEAIQVAAMAVRIVTELTRPRQQRYRGAR